MYRPELDALLQRAFQALEDKVKDEPLTDEDLRTVFEIHIAPRLQRMGVSEGFEKRQLEDLIYSKLRDRSKQLNSEHWQRV